MLCMEIPLNFSISSDDPYSMNKTMDCGRSSLPNVSVMRHSQEHSLKKQPTFYASSDDDSSSGVQSVKTNDSKKKQSIIKIEDIRPYDILCGRDKATFNNIGNRRFRVSISLNIPRYEKARTKAEKAAVIKYVCDVFRNDVGVRFYKKLKSGDGYIELNGSEARKKVGHALRDMSVARKQLIEKKHPTKPVVDDSSTKKALSKIDMDQKPAFRPFAVDPLLEPLPIHTQFLQHENHQSQQPHDQQLITPLHSTADSLEQPNRLHGTSQPIDIQQADYQSNQRRQEQHQPQSNTDLQQTLFLLQQQQVKLQQERQRLLQNQERQRLLYQQQQLQIRQQQETQNLQHLQQQLQQQQQQQPQPQQAQQQHNYQQDQDERHDIIDHFFGSL